MYILTNPSMKLNVCNNLAVCGFKQSMWVLLILLVFNSISSSAQESILLTKCDSSIEVDKGSQVTMCIREEIVTRAFCVDQFLRFPESGYECKKANRFSTLSRLGGKCAVGSLPLLLLIAGTPSLANGQSANIVYASFGGFIIAGAISYFIFDHKSNQHWMQAVGLYNRRICNSQYQP
jgi:hypothetical protein